MFFFSLIDIYVVYFKLKKKLDMLDQLIGNVIQDNILHQNKV